MEKDGETRTRETYRLQAYHRMVQSDDMQRALAIATHYLSVAKVAGDAYNLLKLRTTAAMLGADTNNSDDAVLHMIELIADRHATDLGIDLAWPNPSSRPYHWDVDADFPVEDWRYEVANDDTRLGYREWVNERREQERYDE